MCVTLKIVAIGQDCIWVKQWTQNRCASFEIVAYYVCYTKNSCNWPRLNFSLEVVPMAQTIPTSFDTVADGSE